MDLTKYTNNKKNNNQNNTNKTILDNQHINIQKINNKIHIKIKTKKGLKKYQDFLFFSPTNAIETKSEKEVEKFFKKSIDRGVEGLMFKNINSTYKPGLRTGAMSKLKEVKEEIDVVILAAQHGTGKRGGYYSSFYVGVFNQEYTSKEDMYLIIGKVSSGIKEIGESGHSMSNLTNLLNPLKIKEKNNIVYFEPKIVLEVRYQEIQKSTIYNSGYALRFPRIISLREDKPIEEINTLQYIEQFAK